MPYERLDAAADLLETVGAEAGASPDSWYGTPESLLPSSCMHPADLAWIALLGPDKAGDLVAALRAASDDAMRWSWDDDTETNYGLPHHLPPLLAFADRILTGGAA